MLDHLWPFLLQTRVGSRYMSIMNSRFEGRQVPVDTQSCTSWRPEWTGANRWGWSVFGQASLWKDRMKSSHGTVARRNINSARQSGRLLPQETAGGRANLIKSGALPGDILRGTTHTHTETLMCTCVLYIYYRLHGYNARNMERIKLGRREIGEITKSSDSEIQNFCTDRENRWQCSLSFSLKLPSNPCY